MNTRERVLRCRILEKMQALIFVILMIALFAELIGLAVRLTWGLLKIVGVVIFWPLVLAGLAAAGLIYVALPLLVVTGVVGLIAKNA